ncbi:MAG: glycosyltransferase family 1 protein [Gemmatimonadales bacterium]|nr:glycosyltransferase family 1 protein [Gemmatimonadales bacterium]
MIHIVVDSSYDAASIENAVDGPARIVTDIDCLAGDDVGVGCLILGCRARNLARWVGPLEKIRADWPGVPVIVVTDPDPEVALQLSGIAVSAVVWIEDLPNMLHSAIQAACAEDHGLRLARDVEESTLSPSLRSALGHGLRAATTDRPVRSVRELASAVRYSHVTLSQEFRKSVAGRTTLARFLRALVILRAHELRSSGLVWDRVAGRLWVPRPTLHRQSMRWPGCTLGQLAATSRQHLLAQFARDFARPLLAERTGASRRARTG